MRERKIETSEQLRKAAGDIARLAANLPLIITVTEGRKIRSSKANSRHWVLIDSFMYEIDDAVRRISEHTGYTELETKKIIAQNMPAEQIEILYARTKEAIHNSLKVICNIPSSTRLGTKSFSKFDDVLAGTIAEIIGHINAVTRKSEA